MCRVTGADRDTVIWWHGGEKCRESSGREEEEEQMKTPVGPIHYENIRQQGEKVYTRWNVLVLLWECWINIFIVSHMDLSCLFQRPESWVLGILLLTMNEDQRRKQRETLDMLRDQVRTTELNEESRAGLIDNILSCCKCAYEAKTSKSLSNIQWMFNIGWYISNLTSKSE